MRLVRLPVDAASTNAPAWPARGRRAVSLFLAKYDENIARRSCQCRVDVIGYCLETDAVPEQVLCELRFPASMGHC